MVTALITISVQAQKINYGLKAGLNLSTLDVSPELDPPAPSTRIGINIGGFAEIELLDKVGLRPEVTLSTQGANDEDTDVTQTVKLTYLNTAVLGQYKMAGGLHFFGGPQIGLLVGGEFEEEDKVDGAQQIYEAKSYYKGVDVAVGIGIGYSLPTGIGFDARYNVGLTDNNDDPLEDAFYNRNQELKSRVLQLSVSYTFK